MKNIDIEKIINKAINEKLKEYFNFPKIGVGVLNDRPTFNIKESLKKSSRMLIQKSEDEGLSIHVNRPGKKSNCMVSEIWNQVLANPDYSYLLKNHVTKNINDVIRRYLMSSRIENDKKRLKNGFLSSFLHAYIDFAMMHSPSEKTIKKKGHELYLIATGTTFNSIEGYFIDESV